MKKQPIVIKHDHMPDKSEKILWVQFVTETGIHPSRLGELIEMGWLNPAFTSNKEYIFQTSDVYRTKKLVRLCRDFEISTLAASIIIDLSARIERLEQEVKELRSLM